MKFVRPRIISHQPVAGSFDAKGNPTTTPITLQTAISDVVLGNGTSEWELLQRDGTARRTVTSVEIPSAYNDDATFEVFTNGAPILYVTVNSVALGSGGLTGIVLVMEFNDPDHPAFWIPSKEGATRTAALSAHEWTLDGTGNWIVTSREEHRHFQKARVRFKAHAGSADSATQIVVSWHHNGHKNLIEEIGNDPLPGER